MKLKKLMALAMSGVLAVSMLAGCSDAPVDDNQGDDGQGTVQTSPIVSAVNDAQDKIDFTTDNSLTSALKMAVAEVGANGGRVEENVERYVKHATGSKYDDELYTEGGNNGDVKTIVKVAYVGSETAWTEDAVVSNLAKSVKTEVKGLVDTTFVKYDPDFRPGFRPGFPWFDDNDATKVGEEYRNYTYTGTVSDLVSVTSMNGTTNYYVAYTITQTTAVLTYEA